MRISIVGITGYSGMELLRILLQHPKAEVVSLHASQDMEAPVSEFYPHLKGICDLKIEAFDSQDIRGKRFIANPGCYATATELALIPLLQAQAIELDSIIVDAKSGLTGAGKNPAASSHFVHVHDNYVTYKLNQHQHIPEIVQQLQRFDKRLQQIQFSTSLIPLNRGIVATVYSKLKAPLTREELAAIYQDCYQDKPFVRIQAALPNLHQVVGTNYTDIGFDYNPVTNILTVVAVLDNLIKGAAGQAVQNMNLMLGFPEKDGLLSQPSYV